MDPLASKEKIMRKSGSAEQDMRRHRPKSANGNGGANRRPNGSWSWRMTTADGRRIIGYGKTISEAKAKCEAKAGLAEKGIDPKAAKQTIARYLAWWLADIVIPNRAPKTVKAYRDTVRLHLAPSLGSIELSKLSAQHVTAMLRSKERAGLSPRSVAMIRDVLRGALNVAVRMQMIERNVATLAPAPRQVKAERRMLSPAEARQLLVATDTDRLATLYRLAITLGMRQAEILGLRWVDVDLETGTLRVRQTLQRMGGQTITKEPKTARSRRTLALSPSLVDALVAHRDRQEFERKRAANLWQESGLVFTSSLGTPLIARNLVRDFKRHLRAAGLPEETRFYDLRHAAASLLIADGIPITAVSAMLGHALASTTLNTYAHVLPGAERLTAEAMERLLG
jgi:integrase